LLNFKNILHSYFTVSMIDARQQGDAATIQGRIDQLQDAYDDLIEEIETKEREPRLVLSAFRYYLAQKKATTNEEVEFCSEILSKLEKQPDTNRLNAILVEEQEAKNRWRLAMFQKVCDVYIPISMPDVRYQRDGMFFTALRDRIQDDLQE
jgi:hypothetical protein